ncbi:hypothetical protein AB0J55_01325 [Amycolatopsis sp. NPDC049688]|uniref:hypothetical protein n=1 Tax=Amycolatopsis sp. NPDC049688 TaxID=3154733 RepID=UPI0034488807
MTVRFAGIEPFGQVSGQIDFTVAGIGDIDLRNEAHVGSIRFVPGERHMTIAFDFESERPGGRRVISLEFGEVEVLRIEPYLPTGVDPGYGHALLFGIGHWTDAETGRSGFTVSTTTFEVEFYAVELKATVT